MRAEILDTEKKDKNPESAEKHDTVHIEIDHNLKEEVEPEI